MPHPPTLSAMQVTPESHVQAVLAGGWSESADNQLHEATFQKGYSNLFGFIIFKVQFLNST